MTKITLRAYNREIDAITDQGKIDLAIAHCLHVLKYFPKHVDTYRQLGKAYLENQRLGDAADVFQRVLSAVPDDFVSHIGMSIIREDEGNLDASIWHMLRAYDVQSSNITIQDELRRLYDRRDGIEPPKIRLSRAALARMYARGDLVAEAIAELRTALQDEPERADLLVLLARMYAANQQRVKSIQTCSQILNKLPYCLEANLIISRGLEETNRAAEAEPYLERARELDPYAAFISDQAPTVEQVPEAAVTLLKLDDSTLRTYSSAADSQPEWVTSLGSTMTQESEEEDIDWLLDDKPTQPEQVEDVDDFSDDAELAADLSASSAFSTDPEKAPPDQPNIEETADLLEMDSEERASETGDDSEEQIPDWMKEAGWEHSSEEAAEAGMAESDTRTPAEPAEDAAPGPEDRPSEDPDHSGLYRAEIPSWLQDLAPEELTEDTSPIPIAGEEGGELEDWLQGLTPDETQKPVGEAQDAQDGGTLPADEPGAGPEAAAGDSEPTEAIPDWLADAPPSGEPDTAADSVKEEAEDLPDWLKDLPESTAAEPGTETEEELPDWLNDLDRSEAAEPDAEAAQPDVEDVEPVTGAAQPDVEAAAPDAEAAGQETGAETGSGEFPDWLNQIESPEPDAPQDSETAEEAEPSDDEIPDWLLDMAEQAESSSTATTGEPEDRTGVTLWLERNADAAGDDASGAEGVEETETEPVDIEAEPPSPVSTGEAAEDHPIGEVETEGAPSRLRGIEDEQPGEAQYEGEVSMDTPNEEPLEEPNEGTPDLSEMDDDAAMKWLESLAAKQGASEEELLTAPEDRTDQPPDWVQDMDTQISEPASETEPTAEQPSAGDTRSTDDNLDWEEFEADAQAVTEVEPAEAEDSMDWLSEMDQEEAETEFISQPEEPAEGSKDWDMPGDQTSDIEDADLPDWLKEQIEEDAAAAEASSDVPEWLKDVESGEAGNEPVGQPTEGDSVPDWLQQTMMAPSPFEGDTSPEEEEAPESGEETVVSGEPRADAQEPEPTPDEEQAARADVPDWLMDIVSEEDERVEESGEDVPDWLQQTMMAPSPFEREDAGTAEADQAAAEPEQDLDPADAEDSADPVEGTEETYAWERAPVDETLESDSPFDAEGGTEAGEGMETVLEEDPGGEPAAAQEATAEADLLDEQDSRDAEPLEEADWEKDTSEFERPDIAAIAAAAEAAAAAEDVSAADSLEAEDEFVDEAAAETAEAVIETEEQTAEGEPAGESWEEFTVEDAIDEAPEDDAEVEAPGEPEPALDAARDALQGGDVNAALEHYGRLIRERSHLDQVIEDLNRALEYDHPVNVDVWAALGDAYAGNENLQDALDAYTRAEELLK